MPEVALVAILDADKEGFLRSARSLIQTIGRAARHLDGRAILYGDRVTKSMAKAIEETDRRREIQHAYNVKHGIEPSALVKKILDVMDVGQDASPQDNLQLIRKESKKILSAKEIATQIKQLETKMHAYASDLEFEKAASVRDEIHELQQQLIN
jgi:excinuclease ABC subunit B